MTHDLKHLNENKSIALPSTHELIPAELIALKVYSIELKYYCSSFLVYYKSDSLYVVIFS